MSESQVVSDTQQFTCLSCRVIFRTSEQQSAHYHCDWHRYNLKRKVVGLAPITAESFAQRVQAQQKSSEKVVDDTYCKACRKLYGSKNAYDNHLNSKKHKENEAKPQVQKTGKAASTTKDEEEDEDDMDIEEVDNFDYQVEDCLFCNHQSRSLQLNLKHMHVKHSFYIPDAEYLIDIEGMLGYLAMKIFSYFMCIKCNDTGKCFLSSEAAQMHMASKGHVQIPFDGDQTLEFSDFYDYRPSYPDYDPEDADKEILPPSEQMSLEFGGLELVAPDGSVRAAHRSLARYYNQKFKPEDDRESVQAAKTHALVGTNLPGYGPGSLVKATPKEARKVQKAENQRQTDNQQWYLKIGARAGKLQGRYFRDQVMF